MGGWVDGAVVEIRQAARSLRRSPGFTAAVVVVLGLGVGANAAMFELVDQSLLRPPAYLRNAATVHRVWVDRAVRNERVQDASFSYPGLSDLKDGASSFAALAGVSSITPFVGVAGEAEPLPVDAVSADFWSLFDMATALGRLFGPEEDRLPSGQAVAVLGHGYWQSRFGADPGAVGRDIRIGTRTYTVVGVAPAGFRGVDGRSPVAWIPLAAAGADVAGPDFSTRAGTTWIEVLGRRRVDVPIDQAAGELERAFRDHVAATRDPATVASMDPRMLLAPVLRDRGPHRSAQARIALWLLGMSAVLLLVACANVSTLMLGRALRRQREEAVRTALGMGRRRLLAGIGLETLLLAAGAGLVSIPLAHLAVRLAARILLAPDEAGLAGLSPRSLAVGMAVTAGAGLLAGLVPIVRSRTSDLASLLRSAGADGGRSRSRWQPALLVVQAGLSTVLLVAAGLFVRSMDAVASLDLGYRADRVVLATTEPRLPPSELGSTEERIQARAAATEALLRTVRTLPGVESAALTSTVPFWRNSFDRIYRPDREPVAQRAATHVVSGTYFETMGTRMLRGRPLAPGDDAGSAPVMVVSETMAATLWPEGNAMGRCLRVGADTMPCREVVGVAQDIRRGEFQDGEGLQFYVPWEQFYYGMPAVVAMRTGNTATTMVEPLRRALQPAVGDAAWVRTLALSDRVDMQTRSWITGARIFSAFGALALALAAFGLFSVVTFDVAQRTREFGVRTAVGARGFDLVVLVLSRGMALALLGVGAGLAIAWTAGDRVQSLLFEVPAHDPVTYGAVAGLLVGSAGLACLAPALRSARVDPGAILRAE